MPNAVIVDDIKSLLAYIPAIHKKLMEKYFISYYDYTRNYAINCVESFNHRALQRKNNLTFTEDEFLTRSTATEVDWAAAVSLNKMFAVACEMMPEGRNFTAPKFTAQKGMVFYRNGKVYEIYDFTEEDTRIKTYNLSKFRVPKEIAAQTVRIGILKSAESLADVYPCGIKFFCCVDDDFNVQIVQKTEDSELWDGVVLL